MLEDAQDERIGHVRLLVEHQRLLAARDPHEGARAPANDEPLTFQLCHELSPRHHPLETAGSGRAEGPCRRFLTRHGAVTVRVLFASVSSHEPMLSPVATAGDIVNVSCVPGAIADSTVKPWSRDTDTAHAASS